MKNLSVFFMILVCVFLVGCSKFGGDKGKDLKGNVVAQVGDEKITAGDIEEILSHIPPQYRVKYATSQGRKEIVDGLVSIKMLAWEARNRGIDKKDSVRMKLSYLTDQTLARELENEIKKSYKVSDADIQKYYNEHQDKYVTPERVKARHILVDNEAQAQNILRQIKKGGDFDKLAKQYSKCPSAQRGGDLGWFGTGKMDPAFEKAAFALKPGEVSNVVKSSFGYHIIKLDERKEQTSRSLDQVRKSIERIIQRENVQKEVDSLKAKIKKDTTVAVNENYFKKFGNEIPQEMGEPGMPMTAAPGQPQAQTIEMKPAPAQGSAPAAPTMGPAPAPLRPAPGK